MRVRGARDLLAMANTTYPWPWLGRIAQNSLTDFNGTCSSQLPIQGPMPLFHAVLAFVERDLCLSSPLVYSIAQLATQGYTDITRLLNCWCQSYSLKSPPLLIVPQLIVPELIVTEFIILFFSQLLPCFQDHTHIENGLCIKIKTALWGCSKGD
jgi:hypothetical protein